MPRGVYERRSAQQKAAGKGKVKAKAKAKASPKSKSQPAVVKPAAAAPVQLATVVTTPAAKLADPQPEPQFSRDDFRKPIDDMEGPLLRAYARRIGIMQRDVDGLTQDRLRQNCKALLLEQLED
jgi:hypothetical protein